MLKLSTATMRGEDLKKYIAPFLRKNQMKLTRILRQAISKQGFRSVKQQGL